MKIADPSSKVSEATTESNNEKRSRNVRMRTTKSAKKQEKISGGHGKEKEMAETDRPTLDWKMSK